MTGLLDTEKHKREQKVLADIHACHDNMDRLLFSGKGYEVVEYGVWQSHGPISFCTTTVKAPDDLFYSVVERKASVGPHIPETVSFTVRQVYPREKTITVYE